MKRTTKRKIRFTLSLLIILLLLLMAIFTSKVLLDRFAGSFFFLKGGSDAIVNPSMKINEPSDFAEKLKEKDFVISDLKVASDSSSVIIALKDGPTVYLAKDKDIDWQVSSLQSILTRLTIENKKPKKIDFRYQKPIVNF